MLKHFWWVFCFLSYVSASEEASRAQLTDLKLDKFFTTRMSPTAFLENLERTRDRDKMKLYQHRKHIDVNQRNSMSAHNIDSRYPSFKIRKTEKTPAVSHLQPVNINAEIVSPICPPKKKMTMPPNFSRPLPSADMYESVTEKILREYT